MLSACLNFQWYLFAILLLCLSPVLSPLDQHSVEDKGMIPHHLWGGRWTDVMRNRERGELSRRWWQVGELIKYSWTSLRTHNQQVEYFVIALSNILCIENLKNKPKGRHIKEGWAWNSEFYFCQCNTKAIVLTISLRNRNQL